MKNNKIKRSSALLLALIMMFQFILPMNSPIVAEGVDNQIEEIEKEETSEMPKEAGKDSEEEKSLEDEAVKDSEEEVEETEVEGSPEEKEIEDPETGDQGNEEPGNEEPGELEKTGEQNLIDFLNAIEIGGKEVSLIETTSPIDIDKKDINIKFNFSEKDRTNKFNKRGLMFLEVSGVENFEGSEYFDIKVLSSGKLYTIENNQIKINNNRIEIEFNKNHENFSKIEEVGNLTFSFNLEFTALENESEIKIGDKVVANINIPKEEEKKPSLKITKEGEYNFENNQIDYKITITSEGENKDVKFSDNIEGDALGKEYRNIKITRGNEEEELDKLENPHNLGTMEDGEEIVITYSLDVNYDNLSKDNPTLNKASVVSGDIKEEDTSNPEVNHIKVEKIGTEEISTEDNNERILRWTVNIDAASGGLLSGLNITEDNLKINDKEVGDRLKDIKIISINNVNINVNEKFKTKEEFLEILNNKIGELEGDSKKITIVYDTTIDISKEYDDVNVNNSIKLKDKNGKDFEANGNVGIKIKENNHLTVKKDFIEFIDENNSMYMKWEIIVKVPEDLDEELVITDTLPKYGEWTDSYNKNSTVTIVEGSEKLGKDTDFTETEDSESFKITIGKDKIKGKTIKIEFTTEVNKDRLEANYEELNTEKNINEDKYKHKNEVSVKAGDYDKKASADGKILKKNLVKKQAKVKDGYEYTFTVDVYNPDDTVELTDKFNGDLFEIKSKPDIEGETNGFSLNHVYDNNGELKLTLTNEGIDYSKDRAKKVTIAYSLRIKDGKLQDIYNSQVKEFDNIINWGEIESKDTIEFEGKELSKKIITDPTAENNFMAEFEIIVNEDGVMLGEDEKLELKDTMTNLLLDKGTLMILNENGEECKEASYSEDRVSEENKTVLTIRIPNGQKITIRYKARVLGEKNQKVKITNIAELKGKKVENEKSLNLSGDGYGSSTSIKVKKVDSKNISKSLKGASFELLQEGVNKEFKNILDKNNDNVTFTTDDKGEFLVEGHQENLGWFLELNKEYALKEICAPEGYILDERLIKFKIKEYPESLDENLIGETIFINNTIISKNIRLRKINEKGNALAGAEFTLYDESNNEIAKATSDSKGEIYFKDVEYGQYSIKETKAPLGYNRNKKIIEIKKDSFNNTGDINLGDFKNIRMTGKIKIIKVNNFGEKLPNAKIGLYNSKKELLKEKITNQEGYVEFKDLEKGTYYYKEIEAPTGYILDNNFHKIELTYSELNVDIELVNSKYVPTEPGKPVEPGEPEEPGNPVDPTKPVEPNKPETPNKPDDSGVLGENNKPGNNGNKPNDSGVLGSNNKPNHPSGSQGNNSAPQTGDLGVNAYLILSLVSIVLITLVGKRKKSRI